MISVIIASMGCLGRGWFLVFLAALLHAQTPNNQALSGKYFFRQLSLGTSAASRSLTDPRSLLGTITFDGTGRYTFTAQLVQGSGAASPVTGTGALTVALPAVSPPLTAV